jgi:hypothetical protein
MVEEEFDFLKNLFNENKLDSDLAFMVNKFFKLSTDEEYQNFINEYKLELKNIKAFNNLKDKIAYLLVEKYFEKKS